MAYTRRTSYRNWYNNDHKPVQVSLAWNTLVGAYDLKFDHVYGDEKWGKLKGIIAWIKMTIPYGERDYDDVSHIWTIHEKYFNQLRDILNAVGPDFVVTCVEKPVGSPAVTFTPLDVYFDIFRDSSGEDIRQYPVDDFAKAKKIYFRTAMRLHPDKGGDSQKMTQFNMAWDAIKERHFKQVKTMSQIAEG